MYVAVHGWSENAAATRAASTQLRGNTLGFVHGKRYFSESRSISRHMYFPRHGFRLKCDVFQPCFSNIGPSENGRHSNATPACRQISLMRQVPTYEYGLANSNQKSSCLRCESPWSRGCGCVHPACLRRL